MCILCRVYILKLYFCFSIPIASFVVYTNIVLKDKKYKKICAAHWNGLWRRKKWNCMVLCTAQEFKKNVLKPNALKFIGIGAVSKQKTESRAYLYAFQSHTHFNML